MFCNICGSHVDDGQDFCHICGNFLKVNAENKITSNSGSNVNNINNFNNVNNNNNYNTYNGYRRKRNNNTVIILTTILICIVIVGTVICLIMYKSKNNYYFANTNNNANENLEQGTTTQSSNNTTTRGKYDTAIITDNVYYGLSINSDEDAYNLIKLDSVNQKKDDYPKDIIKIENNIIENYSITAVNLKEMDVDFAKEIENVVKTIYNEYPSARKYLTNLTLTNVDMSQGNLLAFFMPVFEAGFSDTPTGAPCVIKTQIELNSKFFLNSQRMDASVKASSKSGHFPKNATRYSPVAHEFGHYLSFIALLNHHSTDHIVVIDDSDVANINNIMLDFSKGDFSLQMIKEAYNNYLAKNPSNIQLDEWRGQISAYALAKDENGEYIYDETIAEAFHDVYLNGNNANEASKYIIDVLKKYVGG